MQGPQSHLVDRACVPFFHLTLTEIGCSDLVGRLRVLPRLDARYLGRRGDRHLERELRRRWVEGVLVLHREVLGIHGMREDDRHVLLDRIRNAVAKVRNQCVQFRVTLDNLRLPCFAGFGLLGFRLVELCQTLAFGARVQLVQSEHPLMDLCAVPDASGIRCHERPTVVSANGR